MNGNINMICLQKTSRRFFNEKLLKKVCLFTYHKFYFLEIKLVKRLYNLLI